MNRENKPTMRLAVAIHKQLVCRIATSAACDLPEASWQQCQTLLRRAQRAQQQGWNLAARQCERELRAVVGHLYGEFGILAQQLDTSLANYQPISTT